MPDDFGHMVDLILALHRHGVPLKALNLGFFTEWERERITASYEFSLGELEASVREKPVEEGP